jgi:hypothetical protein
VPRLVQKDGRFAVFVDDAPYLALAAQVSNSIAWPSAFPKLWPILEYELVSTVDVPVYWNQFEARPGPPRGSAAGSS